MNNSPLYGIRPIEEQDRAWVLDITKTYWGDEFVVVHDEIFYPQQLPGFIAELLPGKRMGLVTYQINGNNLEIITLNSLQEGRGIGSGLMAAVQKKARALHCSRICVTTTNDNLRAIDFYQCQGYVMKEIRKGAVDLARESKPSIPEVSPEGIPISDEVEFEFILNR